MGRFWGRCFVVPISWMGKLRLRVARLSAVLQTDDVHTGLPPGLGTVLPTPGHVTEKYSGASNTAHT